MQLKQDFDVKDFVYSDTAIAKKIDNAEMTPEQLASLKELHGFLWQIQIELCKEFHTVVNIQINSAFRSQKLNDYFVRTIGASKTSQHMDGQAADTFCTGITLGQYYEALKRFAQSDKFVFGQVIEEFGAHPEKESDDWVHVSTSHGGHINQFMTHGPGPGYQKVKI
jgi:hypothetical protein